MDIVLGLALAACGPKSKTPDKVEPAIKVEQPQPKEKVTLESLDKRVTKIEQRLDAAKAAKAKSKQPLKITPQ